MNRLVPLLLLLLTTTACNEQGRLDGDHFNKLVTLISPELDTTDFQSLVDSVRVAVNKHSVHGRDFSKDFISCKKTKTCVEVMSEHMNKHIETGDKAPEMFCSHRATMAVAMLKKYGYPARKVYVFNKKIQGHIFLEVKSPKGKWQVVDPDYNIYYLSDGERLSLKELIVNNTDTYTPCSELGCSWDIRHASDAARPSALRDEKYYGAGYVRHNESYSNDLNYGGPVDYNYLQKASATDNNFKFEAALDD